MPSGALAAGNEVKTKGNASHSVANGFHSLAMFRWTSRDRWNNLKFFFFEKKKLKKLKKILKKIYKNLKKNLQKFKKK